MSRRWVVTKGRRVIYRQSRTPAGDRLDVRCYPANPEKGAADVDYEGLVVPPIPQGKEITISNRSGDRKKV